MNNNSYQHISHLVDEFVSHYHKHPLVMSHLHSLPNRQTIIDIIHLLRGLLFPGYFSKQNLTNETIEYYVGDVLISVGDQLYEQIELVLKRRAILNQEPLTDLNTKIAEIIYTFFSSIPRLRGTIITDVQAAFEGDPAAGDKDEIVFSYPGIFAVSVYRLAHELYNLSVPLIPRIMTEYAHSITGIDIHPGAVIGSYFFIDHGTGVVIGETSTIGDHVKIYQGVTLGALSTREGRGLCGKKRHPTIEDDVTIYSGASILGGETVIGKGTVIGSNVFITKSVPDKMRVSVKNPELLIKGQAPKEFNQEFISDWVI